jgi:hypothetical protein
METQP